MKRYTLASAVTVLLLGAQSPVAKVSSGFKNVPSPSQTEQKLVLGPPVEEYTRRTKPARQKNKFPFQRKLKKDLRHQ